MCLNDSHFLITAFNIWSILNLMVKVHWKIKLYYSMLLSRLKFFFCMEISLINGHPWSYFKPDNRFFVFRVLFKISNDKFWSGLATFSGCIRVHRLWNADLTLGTLIVEIVEKTKNKIQFLIVNFSLVKSHSKNYDEHLNAIEKLVQWTL